MKVLLLGSTGMLGQAIRKNFSIAGITVYGVATKSADYNFDLTNKKMLSKCFSEIKPDIMINAAANIDLNFCEENPQMAYMINSHLVGNLVEQCLLYNTYMIHISTDHYYVGDGRKKHKETDGICLVNEYARTKYLGECLALLSDNALVVRTNIVGYRGNKSKLTFFEWVIQSLLEKHKLTLFNDFYTSSMTVNQLAQVLLDVIPIHPTGIVNIASSEVMSKKEFILGIAEYLNFHPHYIQGSVHDIIGVHRADSLGLDVSLAEELLGYELPDFSAVCGDLCRNIRKTGDKVL